MRFLRLIVLLLLGGLIANATNETTVVPSADEFEHEMAHHDVKITPASTEQTPISRPALSCPQRNGLLYFTNNESSVYRLRINGSSSKPELVVKELAEERNPITSLTYKKDIGELLFVTKRGNGHVRKIKPDGQVSNFINAESEHFGRITVDPLTQNIYFVEDGFGIGVCDKEVKECVTLVEATSHESRFSNLILHPLRGSMFWIEYEPTPVVKVAGMDGKKLRHMGVFQHAHAISMDAESETLFVADENEIIAINLRTLAQEHFANVRASAMAYFNCELYYVQRDFPSLRVLNSHHVEKEVASLTGSSFVFELVPDNEMPFPFEDPCLKEECPEICALVESSIEPEAICLCKVCGEVMVVEVESSIFRRVVLILLVLFLLTLIAMFLVIYFRMWPALCDRLDHLLGLNAHDASNISVGFNKSELV